MSLRRTRNQAFSLFAFQDIITAVTGVIVLVMLLLTLKLIQFDQLSTKPNSAAAAEPLLKAIKDIEQNIESSQLALQHGSIEINELAMLPHDEAIRQQNILVQEIERLTSEILQKERLYKESLLQEEVLEDAIRTTEGPISELNFLQNQINALREQLEAIKKSNRVIYNPNAKSNKRAWLVDLGLERILVAEVGKSVPPIPFNQSKKRHRIQALRTWVSNRDPGTEYFILLVRPEMIDTYKNIRQEFEQLGFDLGFDLLGSDVTAIDPTTGAVFNQ